MSVYTDEFFLLEGVRHDGNIEVLAVAFDLQQMGKFAMALAVRNDLEHFAFRVSVHGGKIKDQPAPTHTAPSTPT